MIYKSFKVISSHAETADTPQTSVDLEIEVRRHVECLTYLEDPARTAQTLWAVMKSWGLAEKRDELTRAREEYVARKTELEKMSDVDRILQEWKERRERRQRAERRHDIVTIDKLSDIEWRIASEVGQNIGKAFPKYDFGYFQMDEILRDRKISCVGNCQIFLIAAELIGLKVVVLETEIPASLVPSGRGLGGRQGHVGLLVSFGDDERIIDLSLKGAFGFFASSHFSFSRTYRKEGVQWALVNPRDYLLDTFTHFLGHDVPYRRVRMLNYHQLAAAGHMMVGSRKGRAGKLPEAIHHLDHAIKIDPESSAAFTNRGTVFWFDGQPEKAMADANEAIRLNPENALAYALRGQLNRELGNKTEGAADLRRAIELDPSLGPHLNNLLI